MLRLTNDINDPKLQSDIIEDQHRPQPLKHWSDQYEKLQDWKARVIGAHLLAAQATPDCIYTGNPSTPLRRRSCTILTEVQNWLNRWRRTSTMRLGINRT